MKGKKNKKRRNYRNSAAPLGAQPRSRGLRQASLRPASPRPSAPEESALRRLGYTAAGAAGTALVGSFLAREGWAPKTIAGLLTTGGAIASWTSHDPTVREIGSGAMSAAGGQLALLMLDDREKKPDAAAQTATATGQKRSNAGELPPGALESAFERARARMAVLSDDARRYSDGNS